jgi:hypothetical protein
VKFLNGFADRAHNLYALIRWELRILFEQSEQSVSEVGVDEYRLFGVAIHMQAEVLG